MRKKLELATGIILLLVSFMGIPADWKVYVSTAVGIVLVIAGLIELRREHRVVSASHAAHVDGGPPLEGQNLPQ